MVAGLPEGFVSSMSCISRQGHLTIGGALMATVYLKRNLQFKYSLFPFLCILTFALLSLSYTDKVYPGQATLSWNAPTTNVDGTPLTDLAGYKLYYGTASGTYAQNINVGNVTTYTVPTLTDGLTYYFAVTAYDTASNESGYSNERSKAIGTPQFTLTVYRGGTGTGTITSSPAG
jgi:hypothetical protein